MTDTDAMQSVFTLHKEASYECIPTRELSPSRGGEGIHHTRAHRYSFGQA